MANEMICRVGGYTLDMYCSIEGCGHFCGEWAGPIVYNGRSESECLRRARGEGWLISRNKQRDICPSCRERRRNAARL